jgi:CubicO group peptidase (beta-lactamase class C family)
MVKIIKKNLLFKQLKYSHEEDTLTVSNNIDKDILNMNSQFRIGSISKVLTMLSVLIAQEKGKLNLSDSASDYLQLKKK